MAAKVIDMRIGSSSRGVVGALPVCGVLNSAITEPFTITERLADGVGVGTTATGVGAGIARSSLLHILVEQHRHVQLCIT